MSHPLKAETLKKGQSFPGFTFKTQNDKSISFYKDLKKKVTIIVLSNYCSMELAGVWAVPFYYKYYKNKNFRFAFVFSRECVPGFIPNWFVTNSIQGAVDNLRLPYILMDWDNKTTKRLGGTKKYAMIYVVDKKGKLRYKKLLKNPFDSVAPIEKIVKKLL